MTTTVPNPGSDTAIEQGCTCAAMDNAHGQGAGLMDGVPVFLPDGRLLVDRAVQRARSAGERKGESRERRRPDRPALGRRATGGGRAAAASCSGASERRRVGLLADVERRAAFGGRSDRHGDDRRTFAQALADLLDENEL